MKAVRVETGRPYDILIERGLIKKCGEIIKGITKAVRIAVITDSNVSPIYAETVKTSLKEAGFAVTVFAFEAGEQSKGIETICHMYDCLADNNFTRQDMIVALGGGVTGDMAGFAAATYLRGIFLVEGQTSFIKVCHNLLFIFPLQKRSCGVVFKSFPKCFQVRIQQNYLAGFA